MKITLDHNCIIHLVDMTKEGKIIREILDDKIHQCFVVNIGASEMLQRGVFPDDYFSFDALLQRAGAHNLLRLNPMTIIGVTFFDRSIIADDKMAEEADRIRRILFPETNSAQSSEFFKQPQRKIRNRLCDVHSLWCHVNNGNDIFLTTDGNFLKEQKMQALVAIGARRICRPSEIGST